MKPKDMGTWTNNYGTTPWTPVAPGGEPFVVRIPISAAQADVIGMPASVFEQAVRRLGHPMLKPAQVPPPFTFDDDS